MSLHTVDTTRLESHWIASECRPALLPAHAGRPRVLVVEDDDDFRVLLVDELCRKGLDVISCASADETVRQREWIYAIVGDPWSLDVIVTDLRLGEIDGLALLQQVAEAGVDIPVVLISAYADLNTRMRASALGAAAFLDKPVSMETLRRLIDQLARARQQRVRESAYLPRPQPRRRSDG